MHRNQILFLIQLGRRHDDVTLADYCNDQRFIDEEEENNKCGQMLLSTASASHDGEASLLNTHIR